MKGIFCTRLTFTAIVIATSGFHHGFHTGIVNVSAHIFRQWIKQVISDRNSKVLPDQDVMLRWSTIIAIFSVGAILGACLVGFCVDKWGRKRSLFYSNIITLLSIGLTVASKISQATELLYTGRFFSGIDVGLTLGICQIYLIEIAPDDIRGAIGCFYYLLAAIGYLASSITGVTLGSKENWHFMFLVPLVPVFFQVISLPFCPDSPRYLLMTRDDEDGVIKALVWLKGTTDIEEDLNQLKIEDNAIQQMRHSAIKKVCTHASLRKILIICLMINVGQQLSGIKCISFFSTTTFEDVGLSDVMGDIGTFTVGSLLIILCFVLIVIIDIVGRRYLLLASFLGMCIMSLILSYILIQGSEGETSKHMKYLTFVFSVLFLVPYTIGVGPIAWFITAEMFNYKNRGVAVSITSAANWLATFLIGQAFLPLKHTIGYYIVVVFAVLNLFFFFYTLPCPETSKLSPQQIIELLNK